MSYTLKDLKKELFKNPKVKKGYEKNLAKIRKCQKESERKIRKQNADIK